MGIAHVPRGGLAPMPGQNTPQVPYIPTGEPVAARKARIARAIPKPLSAEDERTRKEFGMTEERFREWKKRQGGSLTDRQAKNIEILRDDLGSTNADIRSLEGKIAGAQKTLASPEAVMGGAAITKPIKDEIARYRREITTAQKKRTNLRVKLGLDKPVSAARSTSGVKHDQSVADTVLGFSANKNMDGKQAASRLRNAGATKAEVDYYMNKFFWGRNGRPQPRSR